MQFDLTDEQRAIQDTARRFTAEAITPHAGMWDEKRFFPRATVKAAAELGFAPITVASSADSIGSKLWAIAAYISARGRRMFHGKLTARLRDVAGA